MPLFIPDKTGYRGDDHTAVTNPEVGDFTIESSGKLEWRYTTSGWRRVTPVHWGSLYPADSFAEVFQTVSTSHPELLPLIVGDFVQFIADRAQAGSLTYIGRYNGTTWENISGVDSSEALYFIDQSVTSLSSSVNTLISDVETINNTLDNTAFGLQHFTESEIVYGGKVYTRLQTNQSAADVDLVLSPIGSGAVSFQRADGTSAGGNVRGSYAIDLQLGRYAATQVAQGDYAICVGYGNSAQTDCIAIGRSCTSTGSEGFPGISIGYGCTATEENISIGLSCASTGSGFRNVALGSGNSISGISGSCFVSGLDSSISNGYSSGVLGIGLISDSFQCFSVGSTISTLSSAASVAIGELEFTNQSYATFLLGFGNQAISSKNTLIIGDGNDCLTASNCLILGNYQSVSVSGSLVHSVSTGIGGTIQSRSLRLILEGETSGSTPLVLTSTPGTPTPTAKNQLYCAPGEAITFRGICSANRLPCAGSGGFSSFFQGRVVNYNGTLRLEAYTEDLFNPDGCTLAASLDQTLKTLTFTFTGGVGGYDYGIGVSLDCSVVLS